MFAVVLLALVAGAEAGQEYNLMKEKNARYLATTPQFRHRGFDEEGWLENVAARRRSRSLLQNETAPVMADNILAMPEATTTDTEINGDCPNQEMFGPFGNYYLCPIATGVDCDTEADSYNEDPGTWYTIPTTMRGTWDAPEMWTIPSLMAKGMTHLPDFCADGNVFDAMSFPTCEALTDVVPYSTVCAFNRVYKVDYWALWYMWASWDMLADDSSYIVQSDTYADSGSDAVSGLYQAKIFFPTYGSDGARRRLSQEPVESDKEATTYGANMGSNIEEVQMAMLDLEFAPSPAPSNVTAR